MKEFKDKSIFVTGSCGTVGTEVVKQLLKQLQFAPKK